MKKKDVLRCLGPSLLTECQINELEWALRTLAGDPDINGTAFGIVLDRLLAYGAVVTNLLDIIHE